VAINAGIWVQNNATKSSLFLQNRIQFSLHHFYISKWQQSIMWNIKYDGNSNSIPCLQWLLIFVLMYVLIEYIFVKTLTYRNKKQKIFFLPNYLIFTVEVYYFLNFITLLHAISNDHYDGMNSRNGTDLDLHRIICRTSSVNGSTCKQKQSKTTFPQNHNILVDFNTQDRRRLLTICYYRTVVSVTVPKI
jgi:hypothetical protein